MSETFSFKSIFIFQTFPFMTMAILELDLDQMTANRPFFNLTRSIGLDV